MQKDKALEMALGQIEKQYGKGAIMLMGDAASRIQVSVIPTGCIELDAALGVGGVPRGRIVEIYGPESSGKTTIALHIIAEAQKMGGMCVFIDAEHALDPVYAEKLGISMDKLYVSQPDNGEQALDIADALVRSGAIDVIVVDSVAALVPKAELEGDMGDSHVGLQARLMSQALRKLAGVVGKSRTCVIFINQLREKVGVMFGNPETTTGGKALKFFASIRLDVRKIDTLKQAIRPSETARASKSLKTRLRRLSALPSSTLSTVKAFLRKVPFSIWALQTKSSQRPAHGSPTAISASDRAGKTHAISCATTPSFAKKSKRSSATLSKHPMTKPLPSARTSPIPRMNNSKATRALCRAYRKHAG